MIRRSFPPTESQWRPRSTTGKLGQLRSCMDREWHKSDINTGASEIHRLIALGNFSRIYTTNYDGWLENAHDHHGVP